MNYPPAPSVALVFGTRPEAIKLVPLIRALEGDPRFAVRLVVTGQHREMLDEILKPFGITPHVDLGIMQPGQSLNGIVARAVPLLDRFLTDEKPAMVVIQGDTTSAFCAALAAFHRRIPVAHVEAGLRSFDRHHPFPEEANRRMTSCLADLHLAPTDRSAANLRQEGIPEDRIVVTGNTVVDALLMALRLPDDAVASVTGPAAVPALRGDGRMVLITLHRRENWDAPASDGSGGSVLDGILGGIRRSAEAHPSVDFIYPVHLNPGVQAPARRILGGTSNIHLVAPITYIPFVRLMARATAIVTDSGGIQEEAPTLGVPVFVLRKTTERPEGLAAGTNRLIGTAPADLERELGDLLASGPRPPVTIPAPNPFGDGRAAERTRDAMLRFMEAANAPPKVASAL